MGNTSSAGSITFGPMGHCHSTQRSTMASRHQLGIFFHPKVELLRKNISFVFGQFGDSHESLRAASTGTPMRTVDCVFAARSDVSTTAPWGTLLRPTRPACPDGCSFCRHSSISNGVEYPDQVAVFSGVAETLNERAIRSLGPECGWTQCVSQLGKKINNPACGAIRTG